MSERIFLAGATGAIGRKLLPLLIAAGYTVHGATRKPDRARDIRDASATPVLVDVFDAAALRQAIRQANGNLHRKP